MSEHDRQSGTESGDSGQSEAGAPEKHVDLGVAGRMARAFIHSPLSPLLLLASVAIGIMGLIVTPRQEDPQISVPMVDIMVSYPGVPSEQVTSLVSRPLERLMAELSGVDNVYSVSHRGEAMVTVQFEVGEEMESSIVKVHDKLASNRDRVPPGAGEPIVRGKGADDVPIINLTFWSHEVDDAMLRQIALDAQQQLNEAPNTNQSFVVSGRQEKIRVEVLPERLAGYGLGMEQVAGAIGSANVESVAGRIETGNKSIPVYGGRFFTGAGDIERLLVSVEGGQPVYVRDVANVIYGPGELNKFVRHYTGAAAENPDAAPAGAEAVTLAIAKKPGSNGVTVANDILERLDMLRGDVIPDNVEVAVSRNYGKTANKKVNELIFKLFVATFAVTILVGIFLGLRAAIVVVIVIPVVLLFTVFSAWVLGYTIDRVSLFALIFAIGILVDDAIVVVENIYRRWLLKGGVDTETSVDAVREVGNPTILATFTVIAALLPMGFVTGMMGPYMQPIPALGTVAMLFSLVAAFVFTPWLTQRLRPSMDSLLSATDKEHRQAEKLGRFYRWAIPGLVDNRVYGYGFLFGIIILFFLVLTLFYTTDVRVKMLPLDNKPEFQVMVNFPEGTALTDTATLTHDMAGVLRDLDEVVALQSYVGTASPFNFNGLVRHYYLRDKPWQGDIQVQLVGKGERERTSHEIATEARERLSPLAEDAGARIQVVEMPPGPPVLQSIVAEVYGPDAPTRRQVARDLVDMFEGAKHVDDVDSFLQTPHDVWHFEADRDKALRRGVTVEAINRTLEAAIGGQVLGDVKAQSLVEPHLIEMRLPREMRSNIRQLESLYVTNKQGTPLPLSELGDFIRRPQDEPIYHKNLRPVEYVTGEVVGRLAAPVYGMLEVQDQLRDYETPDGTEVNPHWIGPPPNDGSTAFEWAGEWTVTYETFRDMGIAFAVALILIYMLVVWEFGNFVLPGIIMAPIPLTLIGILPGHWLLNAEFTATSMIGFIALAGIIVRNSILLVDFGREAVREGHDVRDAMILACQARTRPILITALALLAGSSVILFDPIFQGMAVSLMFGTIVATALTLLVIPLGCISRSSAFEEPSPGGDGGAGDDETGGGASAATRDGDGPGAGGSAEHERPARREGGPVIRVLQYGGLYLKSLGLAILEGLRDLLMALSTLLRNWLAKRGDGGGSGPPTGGGTGGSGGAGGGGAQGPGGSGASPRPAGKAGKAVERSEREGPEAAAATGAGAASAGESVPGGEAEERAEHSMGRTAASPGASAQADTGDEFDGAGRAGQTMSASKGQASPEEGASASKRTGASAATETEPEPSDSVASHEEPGDGNGPEKRATEGSAAAPVTSREDEPHAGSGAHSGSAATTSKAREPSGSAGESSRKTSSGKGRPRSRRGIRLK